MDERISSILSIMSTYLDNEQLRALHGALVKVLVPSEGFSMQENAELLSAFIAAKGIDGCARRPLNTTGWSSPWH